jgi:DNA-binding response OmpR family regulator
MLLPIGWALEDKGYNVVRVSSGKAALRVLARNGFDLILIDLDLHKTNGIDLVRKAKQLNPETMVIILCYKEEITPLHGPLLVDADHYIFKPCSKAKLWKRVGNCLESMELKRSIASLELDIDGIDEPVLKKLRTMLDDIQSSVSQTEDVLKQIKRGLNLHTDYEMAIRLRELDKIITRLNEAVAALKGDISEANEDLSVKEKAPDWKEEVINPLLGNFPY